MNHYKCRITLVGSRAGRQYHDDWRTNRIWRRNNISQLLRLHVILFILRRIYMRERGMGRAPFNCRPAASVGGCLCCWALVISGNHYTVPMSMVHNVAWHNTPTLDTPFSYSPRSGGVERAGTFGRARRKRHSQGYKFTTLLPPSRHHRLSEIRGEWGVRGENIYAQQLTRAHAH